jgi:ribosomal protein L39E
MCVLVLKYVPDVYVCIGFEICTRQYTHRHLMHISKPMHTHSSRTYFKANKQNKAIPPYKTLYDRKLVLQILSTRYIGISKNLGLVPKKQI